MAAARGPVTLRTERLGPLPLINHVLHRLGLEGLLDQAVPTGDRRGDVPHARALGVLLRFVIVEREPIYRPQETVRTFAPAMDGLAAAEGAASRTIGWAGCSIGCSTPTARPGERR
jgi:hypothetical protein